MSIITNNQRTFTAVLVARVQVCQGFIKSLLAMFLTFLIPSFKPALPHYTRRARTSRCNCHGAKATRHHITTPSPSPMQRTATCPALPVCGQSPVPSRPRNTRHVSFQLSSPSALLSRSQTFSHLTRRLSFSKQFNEETDSSSDSSFEDSDFFDGSFSSSSATEPESDDSHSSTMSPPSLYAGMRMPSVRRVFSMSRRTSVVQSEDSDSDDEPSWNTSRMRRTKTAGDESILRGSVSFSDPWSKTLIPRT